MRTFLLATSDFGKNIQENLNTVVTDGKFNNGIIRHTLDLTDKNIFGIPNSLEVAFKDIWKFDSQNPVIGNLLCQIEASQLTDEKIEKYLENMLLTNDIKLKERLDKSRKLNNINNNDNNNNNIEKKQQKKNNNNLELPPLLPPPPPPLAPVFF